MTAFNAAVKPATASVTEFLEAAAPLVAPIDAYFEKVSSRIIECVTPCGACRVPTNQSFVLLTVASLRLKLI